MDVNAVNVNGDKPKLGINFKVENKNDLVLITSKIVVTNQPFTYTKTRSIYKLFAF